MKQTPNESSKCAECVAFYFMKISSLVQKLWAIKVTLLTRKYVLFLDFSWPNFSEMVGQIEKKIQIFLNVLSYYLYAKNYQNPRWWGSIS